MTETEIEISWLAKKPLPDLSSCEKKEISDIYIFDANDGRSIRLRKKGDKMELTKKVSRDANTADEYTIPLAIDEFESLARHPDARRVEKTRYFYEVAGNTFEIDIFEGTLKGLVLIECEFKSDAEMKAFVAPDFCGADVSPELFIAGRFLAGKSYADIEENLKKFSYSRI